MENQESLIKEKIEKFEADLTTLREFLNTVDGDMKKYGSISSSSGCSSIKKLGEAIQGKCNKYIKKYKAA